MMEAPINPNLSSTSLVDRTLWYDGDVTVPSTAIENFLEGNIHQIYVDEVTPDIKRYNGLVSRAEQLFVKNNTRPPDFTWNIPEEYSTLCVQEYVMMKLFDRLDGRVSDAGLKKRIKRALFELTLFGDRDLTDMLRALIYIVDTMEKNNIVWGVGRGSSVASYVLYLIGVHDVDSFEYDLDITDFLKT